MEWNKCIYRYIYIRDWELCVLSFLFRLPRKSVRDSLETRIQKKNESV